MFWHGAPLTRIERLSLASFIANGHPVYLHVYDAPAGLPVGVKLCDAARVLPRDGLFKHRRTGSLGPFADWFRYRLLHQAGGIWADTDVVCLRPLNYDDAVVFGWENDRYINTAVLGLPVGHTLAAWMAGACEEPHRVLPYDSRTRRARKLVRRLTGNRRDDVRWGEYGPKGFTQAVRHFGLLGSAKAVNHFYPVPCERWHSVFESQDAMDGSGNRLPSESRTLHLWHAMMHQGRRFDKDGQFATNSLFETLWRRYVQNRRDSDSEALSTS